jgi:predicted secreted hydrolase
MRRPVLAVLALCALGCSDARAPELQRPAMSLVGTLGGADTVGYARATEPRPFVFPEDHGPHPEYRTEWWYVTGNLVGEGGRAFGFQLTIFRNALAPTPPGGPSAWATNQAYMGHFALTDVASARFHAFELFARGAGGLAGAGSDPLSVWIEDWVIESTGSGDSVFPLRVRADGDGVELDLVLEAGKPVVLQGDAGLSQKGPEPGNASYYYALTRMPAEGRVVVDGDVTRVEGLAWLDREWSTSALSPGQVGWDWFALQLEDGWEMMVYQLRREDGTADGLSDGVLIDPDGERHPLAWGSEVTVEPTGTWRSPVDGTVYPSGWRIRVPARDWDLRVTPVLEDQELRLAFRYWEGAVRVHGTGAGGDPVEGWGYVELTGYDGALVSG